MRRHRWGRVAAALLPLAAVAFGAAPRTASAQTVPRAFLLGDSVLHSIDVTPAANASLGARHDYAIDAKVCRRLIVTSCSSGGVTPNTAIDALRAARGTYGDVLVVEAGYNDSSIGSAVDTIVAEARSQGVRTILWLTYHEGGANAATYRAHNATLRTKANQYPELGLVDFNGYAHAHPEWFASDGLHLKASGALGLAELIGDALDASYSGNRCSRSKATSTAPAAGATAAAPGGFHALATPSRLVDTRSSALPPGRNRLLGVQVTGRSGIPADATAAVVTATAVNPCADTYLTVFPCGSAPPTASAVNLGAGATVANGAVVRLSDSGALCVFSEQHTDVLIDVTAWIGPGGSGATALVPARLVDTRPDARQLLDSPKRRIKALTVLSVATAASGLTAGADTVAVNLTAASPGAAGYLTLFPGPCTATPPTASNLNVEAGRTAAAGAVTAVGPDGSLCVFSSVDTDVIVDLDSVNTVDGKPIRAISPLRLYDSRQAPRARPVESGEMVVLEIPADASGAVLNVTAAAPSGDGYVTVAPCSAGDLPYVSNLNLSTARTVANLVVVSANEDRRICLRSTAATHLLVDVEAWVG